MSHTKRSSKGNSAVNSEPLIPEIALGEEELSDVSQSRLRAKLHASAIRHEVGATSRAHCSTLFLRRLPRREGVRNTDKDKK